MTGDMPDPKAIADFAQSLIEAFDSAAERRGFDSIQAWANDVEARRFDYEPENGIYQHAELTTAEGATFRLRGVYFWSTNLRGERLVDIREVQLPTGIDLGECSLTVYGDAGVPLFNGPLKDGGNETLGDSRCVTVEASTIGEGSND